MKTNPVGIYRTIAFTLFTAAFITTTTIGDAADAAPAASFFVTLTNDAAANVDNSPSAVTQAPPGNGWDYSAIAPVPGATWNKVGAARTTVAGSGPYTDENPFVINTLDNFQLYDANGALTSVRINGAVIGSPTGADPRLLGVTPGAVCRELLKGTWGTNSSSTAAYLKFTLTGLAPDAHYVLYAYSNAADPNQGAKWILHPDNYPAITSSTYFYPSLPDRQTTYLDLAGHIGAITVFSTSAEGKLSPVPGAVVNVDAQSGDNTPWGAMHIKTTANGQLTFRGAETSFATRRWMTGFQLIPYPKPAITGQPPAESVAVLNVPVEITAVARDMTNLKFTDEAQQNPLTYTWQVSTDNGANWTDIVDDDPANPQAAPTGPYDVFLDRDPPLPANPDDPTPPVKRYISTLVLNSPQFADAGLYRLKVTNIAGGSTYSDPCELTIIEFADPFHITRQPVDASCVVGDNVSLAVSVAGTPPFTYIWQKQSCDTAAATPAGATPTGDFEDVFTVRKSRLTDSTLDFPFIHRADTGYYRVKIMDVMQRESDAIHSDTVYLYVEYAPPIITPPGRQTVVPGNTISLYSDIYTEIPLLWHQWQVSRDNGLTWQNITEGGAYSGATTDTLTITGASASEAALYRVVSANDLGTTEGGAIALTVAASLVAHPVAVAADAAGHVYALDDTTNTLYQYTLGSGTAVVFAGQPGVAGSADGHYGQITFSSPAAAAIGPANVVYVADTGNATIRAIRSTGAGTTLAGSPGVRGNTDATGPAASFTAPAGITYDDAGNLYVADKMAHTIRRITPTTFDVTTLAGVANNPGAEGGVTAESPGNTVARFNSPGDIAASPVTFAASGSTVVTTGSSTSTILYVADTGNNTIRKIALTWYLDRDPITNTQTRARIARNDISTLAGMTGISGHADGDGATALFNSPSSLVVDVSGSHIYVADTGNNVIRKISLSGANGATVTVDTVAGLPAISGYQDGPGAGQSLDGLTHNRFNQPRYLSIDGEGNLYVADTGNAAVRKISPEGAASTLVFDKGANPVPPDPGTGGVVEMPDIPPAGAGNGRGEFGGGAPSLWFLAALALLGLARVSGLRRHLMKTRHLLVVSGIIGACVVTTPAARAADAPAVFVKLSRDQAPTAGATITTPETITVANQGSGWDYSGAAPYPGTTWNKILRPHADDRIPTGTDNGGVGGTFGPLTTADNIALFAPDNSASGVTLSAYVTIDGTSLQTSGSRSEPSDGYISGYTNTLMPSLVVNNLWRLYSGNNVLTFTLSGLPANSRYLAYFYGALNNGGARFDLDPANVMTPNAAFVGLRTDNNNEATNVFVVDGVTGDIAPVPPAPPNDTISGSGIKPWGYLPVTIDATGKLAFTAKRFAGNVYAGGFQLIPYPKSLIDRDVPSTLAVPAGGTATIEVAALGFDSNDSVTYQWRKNGVPIDTADNATANTGTLIITDAQTTDEAGYDVVITNYGGSVTSGICALEVLPGTGAPVIYAQPVATTGITGASVTLSVAVGGQPPLVYAWQKSANGIDFAGIENVNASSLALSGITTADAGYYRVNVSNDLGTVTSDAVTLIVAPVITAQPQGAIVPVGSPATLTVAADTGIDASPFAPTYQWQLDGVDVPGATGATLTIASFTPADAGSCTVVVSNAAGSVTSAPAQLAVPVAPVFTTQPAAAQTVLAGMPATFTAFATGVPAPAYQWSLDGIPITSATNATLTIANTAFADSGAYAVTASNMAGSVTSDPALLTVRDPAGPAIVPDGFGANATGGANGATHIVTTAADLQARCQLDAPAIIIVSGTINLSSLSNRRVSVKSDKTIQGADANATVVGALNIADVNNVIVRGLTCTNPGTIVDDDPASPTYGKYKDSGDGISVWNSTNVFITHCTFYDCGDGSLDITRAGANNVTASWCKFHYSEDARVHRFVMILGNIEPDNPDYTAPVHATLHHSWWGANCHERMPASTSARGHMYDNYFSCSGNYYANNARNNSQLFIEHSYYDTGVNNPVSKSAGTTALIRTIANIYNGTTGSHDAGADTVFTPPYSYQMTRAADVPALLREYAGNTDGAFSANPPTGGSAGIAGLPDVVFPGGNVSLMPSLPGDAGDTYQWRLDNFEIPGATNATLALANVQGPETGAYTLAITKADGSIIVSSPVTLAFGDAPSFAGTTGGNVNIVSGKSATIQPILNGIIHACQWQMLVSGEWVNVSDNANYSGATTGALTIRNAGADQAGQYRLVATNPTGSITSNAYTLVVTPVVLAWPSGVAVDAFGDVYIADASSNTIRRISATGAAILYAGIPNAAGYQDGDFGNSTFNSPGALAIDASGNLYVADTGNATIRHIDRTHYVRTLAGDPTARGSRDGIGTAALFTSPHGLTFDRTTGITYIADTNNHTIRSLTPRALNSGIFVGNTVATLAGAAGQSGYNDAEMVLITTTNAAGTVSATLALNDTPRFNHPGAVAYSGSYLYIADTGNNTIRRLTLSGSYRGEVRTVAGTPGVSGCDDGGGLDEALFNQPKSLVISPSGSTLYVADTGNNTIRRIAISGSNPVTVTTLAGLHGVSGQGDGDGSVALFNQPSALAIDITGSNLYVADVGNTSLRRIALTGDTVTVSTLSVVVADDSTLPPSGTTSPVPPGGNSSGGGGALSHWYIAGFATLALARYLRRKSG